MKVFAITLGCKVNQYETQVMLANMQEAGFTVSEHVEGSDVVIINSCTVTAASDHKVRQTMHRVRRVSPSAVLVLTGCMPQAFPEAAGCMLDADIVLGNTKRASLVPYVLRFLEERQRIVDIGKHEKGELFEPMHVEQFHERTRAFLKIEDGCNRFCSYCIIPYARGRVRSKPLSELRQEVQGLSEHGYREVVLTGINLSAYGQELGLTLCDAVEAACSVPGIERVRLGSLEPEQMDEAVIARMAKQEKLCPQFHLSLQSGCDDTLRRMNRHYDTAEYRRIVANLRAAFANAAITTDIMVGFPGETKQEFELSLAFAQKIGFAKAHVFAYSRRPGTAADAMRNQIPNKVKEERSAQMIEATQRTREAFLRSQIGRTETVLFEQVCEPNVWEGYTRNYTPVRVVSSHLHSGELRQVILQESKPDYCIGSLVSLPLPGEQRESGEKHS